MPIHSVMDKYIVVPLHTTQQWERTNYCYMQWYG